MKSIYDLKLHEQTILDCGICILRVPGGWLYDYWDCNTDTPNQGIFVPYDNEFSTQEAVRKHDSKPSHHRRPKV